MTRLLCATAKYRCAARDLTKGIGAREGLNALIDPGVCVKIVAVRFVVDTVFSAALLRTSGSRRRPDIEVAPRVRVGDLAHDVLALSITQLHDIAWFVQIQVCDGNLLFLDKLV